MVIYIRILTATCFMYLSSFTESSQEDIFSEQFIKKQMKHVADWQLNNLQSEAIRGDGELEPIPPNGWVRGTLSTGIMALYKTTYNSMYLEYLLKWGQNNDWQPGPRERHADDHAVGQTYLDLYFLKKEPRYIMPIKCRIDQMILDPKFGTVVGWEKKWNWSWCDALFMAPPTIVKLYQATKEEKYLDFLDRMWWETTDYLYSHEDSLFYRDANYKPDNKGGQPKTMNGLPVFWGRGNGWVIAGLVRVLESMPEDHKTYHRFLNLYIEMSTKIVSLQAGDGLWRSSLLDFDQFPQPETSCSAFFCYALAWGINNGYLEKDKFTPAAKKAWKGLNYAVFPSGKLGWVQSIGHEPREIYKSDSMEYGVGAYLLAGSEIVKLELKK